MRRQEKFLSILLFFSLVLIFYIFLSSQPFNNNTNKAIVPAKENKSLENNDADMDLMENEYKKETKELIYEYENINLENAVELNKLLSLEERLLNLEVPSEYKNLHIEILFALIKMEDYFKNNSYESREISQNTINNIKGEYKWLNE